MTEKELLELKDEITEAKQKASELKGEYNALLKRIKVDWGCSNAKELKAKKTKYEAELTALNQEIDFELSKLDEALYEE